MTVRNFDPHLFLECVKFVINHLTWQILNPCAYILKLSIISNLKWTEAKRRLFVAFVIFQSWVAATTVRIWRDRFVFLEFPNIIPLIRNPSFLIQDALSTFNANLALDANAKALLEKFPGTKFHSKTDLDEYPSCPTVRDKCTQRLPRVKCEGRTNVRRGCVCLYVTWIAGYRAREREREREKERPRPLAGFL